MKHTSEKESSVDQSKKPYSQKNKQPNKGTIKASKKERRREEQKVCWKKGRQETNGKREEWESKGNPIYKREVKRKKTHNHFEKREERSPV